MYLKSIEIQGFKSFANKILFEFHNGITGIVGPNGSGKSNVADAVRWVLGEQRIKQLRGASMQDVIFAGTELRKPQGFAYVAITLDNSDHQLAIDFDEVTVSRRLYRSGESEYKINGSVCRLKDINELFYDTGIGKEGYSIIGQGQIDKILSGKPEERRELFDEAAGIVKFKRRKAIAQKKLEDEKNNLIRVSDILTELEKQVGPLAKQSETAREYLKLKEELKIYDVNLFLTETEEIKKNIRELESKESIVSGDLEDAKTNADGLKQEYDALEQVLEELERKNLETRNRLNEKNVLKGSLEGQINVLNEQINTVKMNEEHIKNRTSAICREIEGKKDQTLSYEKEKQEIEESSKDILEKQKNCEILLMETDTELAGLEGQIEEAKGSIIDTLNEKSAVTARQQRYETMMEQVNVRRSEVSQKLLKSKSDESVQDEQIAEEEAKLTKVEKGLEEILVSQEETEEEVIRLEGEVKRLSKNISDRQQDYHTANTKLESLRNLAERYEGYGGSIRRVMELRSRVPGIHGVVADIITVKKQFETAIETALGGSIQNIVTDSEQTAKELIEYLKKNKYGRATFLPLNSVGSRGGFSRPQVAGETGVLGMANELVETAPEYQGLMQYLLGRVVVTDTIDHAIALARKHQYSLRIVTLEGELLNAGGSMTGGAFKNTSNLLGRKREIEELENQCKKAALAMEKLIGEQSMNEGLLTEAKEKLEQLRTKKQAAYLEQNTLRMNISQMEEKKAEIAESAVDMVREHRQLEEQAREIAGLKAETAEKTAELERKNREINDRIEVLSKQQEQRREEREEQAKDLSAIQLETAGLFSRQNFIKENIRRVEEEIRALNRELKELSGSSSESQNAISEKLEEIERIRLAVQEAEKECEELNKSIISQTAEKEEKSGKQKQFFTKREEASQRITILDKEIFRLQGQKEKLEERLENHVSYMWNEYELTFSRAEALRDPELTVLSEIKKRIDQLKSDIKKLGNVNVNAIEDYKVILERYEFTKIQHDDLVEAEGVLQKIIQELDEGMRRQFEEKFREIRAEFDKVFKELFGGGRGTLELMEGEDILEAGIQIISQPPGKKLQNMMQLSGGEKALTAIALLFAIQNLKPSPFCLLDEIEAALDDSNVDRFAGYLHKLTKNTQFIIITHRRGTMVASDRLYGITMQEKGISTLVSVNLIEADLDD